MKRRISTADRPYVEALAGGLVRQGYRRVAIEALNPDVDELRDIGHVESGPLVAYALSIAAAE